MKLPLSQVPISGKANKCQRLFTADEVLDDLDNSENVENKGRIHDSLQSMGAAIVKNDIETCGLKANAVSLTKFRERVS